MKRYILLTIMLCTSPVWAYEVGDRATWDGQGWVADQPKSVGLDVIASYDYYLEPNNHNYEDAWGFTLGVEHGIAGNLKGQVVYKHLTDVRFPAIQDPKGAWGEMRGHVAMYNLKYDMPYNEHVGAYLMAGIGYGLWTFFENPLLQDLGVTVDLDESVVVQLGVGLDVALGNGWRLDIASGWFDTDIGKDISENEHGIVNILDSGDIGLQYVPIRVGVRKSF